MLAGAHQACRRGEGRVRAAADTAKVLGDVTGEGLQRTWVSMAREFYLIRREVADVCLRVTPLMMMMMMFITIIARD